MPTYCIDLTAHNTLARQRGIGRYGYELARALRALRSELAADERLIALARVRGANAFVTDLDIDRVAEPLPPPKQQASHYRRYFRSHRLYARRTLERAGVDVVHFLEGHALETSRAYRSVVTCHDLVPLVLPRDYLKGALHELILRAKSFFQYHGADRVIAISHATARDLDAVLGLPRGRAAVIHQGVCREHFHPQAAANERALLDARGIPPRYLIYIGAHDPRKRVPVLLRAQRSVFRATGVPLVLVGAWLTDLPRDLRQALSASSEGSIILLGGIEDGLIAPLYRHAEVHVLPSVYEGFGLTVLEAMASGCPVITTRESSLAEVGGEAARYVAPDSVSSLEAALFEVLRNPDLRREMIAKGLAQAARFTWQRAARATLEVYRAAVGRSTGPGTLGDVSAVP